MLRRLTLLTFVSLTVISLCLLSFPVASAGATATCQVSVTPTSATVNNQTSFTFNFVNNQTTTVSWIVITTPWPDDTITAASASGWTASISSPSVTFNGGSVVSGGSLSIVLQMIPGSTDSGTQPWNFSTYDNSGRFGTMGTLICSNTSDTLSVQDIAPHISNLQATNITYDSVTITWQTLNPATSQVAYGLTSSYGSTTPLNSNYVTNHSVNISGLQANTTYHYQVTSTTSGGGTASSSDSTFTTAEYIAPPPTSQAPLPSQTTTITPPPVSTPSKAPIVSVSPPSKTLPKITLTGSLPKVVKTMPSISGTVSDTVPVSLIQFSVDGGVNWLPVNQVSGLGTTAASFTFQPIQLADGTYKIEVRAYDVNGSQASTAPVTVVVDHLPPIVGGSMVSIGPQVLYPDKAGVIRTLVGVGLTVNLSAVGGATNISLVTSAPHDPLHTSTYTLTYVPDTGLWHGVISFQQPGTYTVLVQGRNGAGDQTSRLLYTFAVLPAAKVITGGSPGQSVKITVYYLSPDSNTWIQWDAQPYGQQNPVTTNNGNFSLLLAPGRYYLHFQPRGGQAVNSTIFSANQPTPISATVNLEHIGDLAIGPIHIPWFSFLTPTVPLKLVTSLSDSQAAGNKLTGQTMPTLTLSDLNNNPVNDLSWLGKPTVVSVMSTWMPATADQIKIESQLQHNGAFNVVPVAMQEGAEQVQAFDSIAGYQAAWLTDPNSTLTAVLNPSALPTHYFIDRNGVIRKVVYGVLSKQEILNALGAMP